MTNVFNRSLLPFHSILIRWTPRENQKPYAQQKSANIYIYIHICASVWRNLNAFQTSPWCRLSRRLRVSHRRYTLLTTLRRMARVHTKVSDAVVCISRKRFPQSHDSRNTVSHVCDKCKKYTSDLSLAACCHFFKPFTIKLEKM